MNKILVVDDEMSIRESFGLILEGKYQVLTAASGEGALKQVASNKIDLAFLDIRMPGMDGLETLKRIKEIDPDVDVVMVTAVNEVEKASVAINIGARDYLIKPFDVNAILKMTDLILRRRTLTAESASLGKKEQLIGNSEKISLLIHTAKKAAAKQTSILIRGEIGTEKAAVAQFIHEHSPRKEFPFASLALSSQMSKATIKAKIFGQTKSLTVVDLKKESGLLEAARGGTLFIDHIEHLPPLEGLAEVRIIGGSSQEKVDFVAEEILTLPPLRERLADLPLLMKHYLELFNWKYCRNIKEFSREAEEVMVNYPWPGNTEQLKNIIERLVLIIDKEKIEAANLPIDLLMATGKPYGRDYLELAWGRNRTGMAYSAEGF